MRDSRRRRMIIRDEVECDDALDRSSSSATEADNHDSEQPAYTAGARIENQPRLVDFIPTRVVLVCGIFMMLVAVISLLNFAHFKILPFADSRGISAQALELSLDRGLLSWVASFLLLATAFFCFQVFQVRRYRADDFKGSYRVWIWLSIGFVLASIDATARISPIVAKLISANWESGLLSVDRNVWYLLVGIPAVSVATRLVLEIWKSRIAIGSISVATVAYVVANLVRLDVFSIDQQQHAVVEANSVIVAHSFVFFTIVCYARFVLVESQIELSVVGQAKSESETQAEKQSHGAEQKQDRSVGRSTIKMTPKKSKAKKVSETVTSDEADLDVEDEQATLKLMGQSVQPKKGSKKRKGGQQSRRRAA